MMAWLQSCVYVQTRRKIISSEKNNIEFKKACTMGELAGNYIKTGY
jgi:hypothetical protein